MLSNQRDNEWEQRWVSNPGAYVKSFRAQFPGLTQKRLAEILGLTKNTIEKIETGRSTPSGFVMPRALRDLERELKEQELTKSE